MARRESLSMTRALNAIAYVALIFLAFAMSCSTSTRILDEVERPEAEEANNAAESHVADQHHTLSFFMHDILGGSNPTARAVTGVVTNPALNAQVAFAKPNGANLPLNNGVPQNNNNGGILNNTTFLSSPASAAPRPTSSTTAAPVSRAVDGTSQVMAFTAKFEENGYVDSLSFFGVHRAQVSESQIAIIGGTGKYVNAEGYAIIKTFPLSPQQHNTDGVQTLLQLTAYLAY
ncbi:hypothetical protein glysoja_028885 [Glycine soja]|uniref:Dirigent protein n=1 Tax=Glycine soja TaxID=3848 RepID=A0A0B2RFK9_GLYSO|nr:hypothetical protein glysoja_028885 [Glycine soja]